MDKKLKKIVERLNMACRASRDYNKLFITETKVLTLKEIKIFKNLDENMEKAREELSNFYKNKLL